MWIIRGEMSALPSRSPSEVRLIRLRRILRGVLSLNRDVHLEAMISLKSFLANPNNSPLIDQIARSGVVPRLVHYFGSDDPAVKLEATHVLARLTASEDNHVLLDCGVIPLFIQLLSSDMIQYRYLGVRALENIIVKSSRHVGYCLDCGVMQHLLANFTENLPPQVLAATASILHQLFIFSEYSHPAVDEQTNSAVPVLGSILWFCHSDQVRTSATASLVLLSQVRNPETIGRLVSDARIIPGLINLLHTHSSSYLKRSSLRIIHDIVKTQNRHTRVLVRNGFLQALMRLLNLSEDDVVKMFSSQILFRMTLLDIKYVTESGLMYYVIHNFLRSNNMDIKRYAVWVVSLVSVKEDQGHTRFLVTEGCIEILCELLTCQDFPIVKAALHSIGNILKVGQLENHAGEKDDFPYKTMFISVGGFESIKCLVQSHIHGDNITSMASSIIEEYW